MLTLPLISLSDLGMAGNGKAMHNAGKSDDTINLHKAKEQTLYHTHTHSQIYMISINFLVTNSCRYTIMNVFFSL